MNDLFYLVKNDILTSDLFDILESFYLIFNNFELLQMPYTLLLKVVAALLVVLTVPQELQIFGKELGTLFVPANLLRDDFPMVARFKIAPLPVVGLTFEYQWYAGRPSLCELPKDPFPCPLVQGLRLRELCSLQPRSRHTMTRFPPQKIFSALALISSLATVWA